MASPSLPLTMCIAAALALAGVPGARALEGPSGAGSEYPHREDCTEWGEKCETICIVGGVGLCWHSICVADDAMDCWEAGYLFCVGAVDPYENVCIPCATSCVPVEAKASLA